MMMFSTPKAKQMMAYSSLTAMASPATLPSNKSLLSYLSVLDEEDSSSYVDKLTTLARDEGLEGLFAGATPRVGKALFAGAIQFATYEETKQSINSFLDKKFNA